MDLYVQTLAERLFRTCHVQQLPVRKILISAGASRQFEELGLQPCSWSRENPPEMETVGV